MSVSDKWQTPKWLFDELSEKYGPFDIDLCATKENSKCKDYYTDYLGNNVTVRIADEEFIEEGLCIFEGARCFMNPPYSNPLPFIQKAWEDSKHCKVVCLVKVDPSTKWWSVFWNYDDIVDCHICGYHGNDIKHYCIPYKTEAYVRNLRIRYNGSKPGCTAHFLPKRVQFDPPPEMNAWKEGNKWYTECNKHINYLTKAETHSYDCYYCKGAGKKSFSGPSFSSCVLIFDRRGL